MKKIILALAFLVGSVAGAAAACTSPAVMHDFPGTSFNMSLATNAGDGNCSSNVTVVGTLPAYTVIPAFKLDLTTPGTTNLVALTAETTKVIGTVRNVGNVGGVFDAIGQNVAAPANWTQSGCQFNTTPTTITTGNGSPCQVDSAGNLLVNVKADATAAALLSAVQAATPTGPNRIGYTTDDPCNNASPKAYTNVNVVTATNVIIAGVAAKNKYICGIFLYPAGTVNIAVYQATTGTSCATAQVGIFGGTTTATGFQATATAGFVVGVGSAAFTKTTVVNTDICITTSAAIQVSGVVVTADQ